MRGQIRDDIFNDLVELLKGMVRIPSFSREEKGVADLIGAWLEEHGLKPRRKGNNLWLENSAANGNGKPLILLNAHIDTVRPASGYTVDPFAPLERDGKLYGLGTNDDGASVIATLGAFLLLSSTEQPYRLIWSATAEEEVCGSGGIESIFPDIGPVDLGIIGEPTRMEMAVAEKGLMVLDCTCTGKSGHAAREEGINAIYLAIKDIDWFREFSFPLVSPYLGPVKMSVTQINAGTQHNMVPDRCTFVADIRSNGMYSNIEILETIKEHVSCEAKERSTRLGSSHISGGHPIVKRAGSIGLNLFGSSTTSNQALCKFPTVKIGPGDSARSHSADEYIFLEEIREAIGIYFNLLDSFCPVQDNDF